MSADYKLVVRSKAGAKVEETADFLELAYQKRANQPGLLKFRLRGDHKLTTLLQEDYQVEVWRRNVALGLPWYADFRGLFSASVTESRKTTTFTATVPGQMTLLARRIIAYPANTSGRSSFTNARAETLLKALVRYNATAQATTANGRDKAGVFNSFSVVVEADQSRGSVISWAGSRKSLLGELQRIAAVAGGDFDLVRVGPASWEFRFYPGQLGVDRSASAVFSLSRGNMSNPKVEVTPRSATIAIVGGQGKDEDRDIQLVGDLVGDGPEVFVDGRNDSSPEALATRGEIALEDAARKVLFTFDVIQTPRSYYGLHYGLGDLVKAEYAGISAIKGVRGVSVAVKGGAEDIAVETE